MSTSSKEPELEIDEDILQQQKVWRIERISWGIMALIVTAALLGFFGAGPVSSTIVDDPATALLIHYERFARINAQTLFRIHLDLQQNPQGLPARLSVAREFLDKVALDRFEPAPVDVEAWSDHITYVFTGPDPAGTAQILVYYTPLKFGKVEVEMGLDGYPAQTFSQFIYP